MGLTAELDRPDLDLRKKILKNKISHDGVVIPDDVFNFIASNVTENVRDVEGIVASLLAYSTAFNRMIDLPLSQTGGEPCRKTGKEAGVCGIDSGCSL